MNCLRENESGAGIDTDPVSNASAYSSSLSWKDGQEIEDVVLEVGNVGWKSRSPDSSCGNDGGSFGLIC